MKQTLCDYCHQVIDRQQVTGDEAIFYVCVASGDRIDGLWREYHRRCARELTVAEVWKSHGLVPL